MYIHIYITNKIMFAMTQSAQCFVADQEILITVR